MDTFERVDPEGLKQTSVVLATFAYDAAMRKGPFPRAAVTP
jgi:carboxypeptidase Q